MNLEITVRPLRRGEENIWVSLGVSENEREARRQKLTDYLARNPNLPPEHYLIAYQGEQLVGKMSGIVESTGYILTGICLADDALQREVASALLNAIEHFGKQEALSWAREDNSQLRGILRSIGFVEKQDKAYYRKEIACYHSPYRKNFCYRSIAEIGKDEFLAVYRETYIGNLNRNYKKENPDEDFHSHVESAGELFDAKAWLAIYENQEPIGIVLPQRFPDDPYEGTLMSVGLVPKARSKGYGKILHAKGMEILAQQGATEYVGSTDVQNEPMIRVFEENGCQFVGIRTTHERV
jgi:ribosomal protein S18 acetylase RimI-like enzyme